MDHSRFLSPHKWTKIAFTGGTVVLAVGALGLLSPATLNVQAADLTNYTATFDSTHLLKDLSTRYGIATPNGNSIGISYNYGYSSVASDLKSISVKGTCWFSVGYYYSSTDAHPYFQIGIIQSVTLYYTMPSGYESSNLSIDFRTTLTDSVAQSVSQAVSGTTYTLDSTVSTKYYGASGTTGRDSLYFAVGNNGIDSSLSCTVTGITIAYKC